MLFPLLLLGLGNFRADAFAYTNLCNSSDSFNITIGVLLTESGSDPTTDGSRAWRATETRNVTNFFKGLVEEGNPNATGVYVIDNINFEYADVGTGSNSTLVTAKTVEMCSNPNYDFVIAPFSSGATQTAAIACMDYDKILISGGAASEAVYSCLEENQNSAGCSGKVIGTRRFDNLFGAISLSSSYMEPAVTVGALRGATSIAFFNEASLFTSTMCDQAQLAAAQLGYTNIIPSYTLDRTDDNSWDTLFNKLTDDRPDVVIGCVLTAACERWIQEAESRNYLPNFVALSVCIGSSGTVATLGNKLNFIAGPVQWDSRCTDAACSEQSTLAVVRYYNQSGITAPVAFNNEYLNYSRINPSYQAAGSQAALYSALYAVQRACSTGFGNMLTALNDISQPSFFGRIEASRLGANQAKQMILLQYDQYTQEQIIAPLSTNTMRAIYPIPTWDERVYTKCMYCLEEEKGMIGIVVVNSVMLPCLAGFIIAYRNHPAIKATSVTFVIISLFGLLCINLSMVTWPLENDYATCTALPWLVGIGVTLFICPIALKMWRIKTIFDNIDQPVKITSLKLDDISLLKRLAIMMLPTLIILVLWQTIDPLTDVVEQPDPIRPSKNYTICKSDTPAFAILLLTYFLLLLLVLAGLSFATRKAWNKFKESQQMAFALYGFIVCTVVLVALQASEQGSREYLFVVRVAFITIAIWTWCVSLYGPKIWAVCSREGETSDTIMISNADNLKRPTTKHQTSHTPQIPKKLREMKEAEDNSQAEAMEGKDAKQQAVEYEAKYTALQHENVELAGKVKILEERIIKLVEEKVEAMNESSVELIRSRHKIMTSRGASKANLDMRSPKGASPKSPKVKVPTPKSPVART